MKKFLLILITFLSANLTLGQTNNKENELTIAEKFSLQPGTIIQKEFIDLGKVKSEDAWGTFSIYVVIYTDLVTNNSYTAVIFENISRNLRAILDSDEIDELIMSIKMLQEKVFLKIPTNYTEVDYSSRSGFNVGCYWKKETSTWDPYIKFDKSDDDTYFFIDQEYLVGFLGKLEEAKTMLK